MLLLSTLLFMPRYPRPRGAAIDGGLFSTFFPSILEHFTKTGSSPSSAFVKEAITLSPQMSPGSWEPSRRGCQFFFRRLGFPQLAWDIHLWRAWFCTEVWLKEHPQALPWLCSSGWWVVVGFFLSPPLFLRRSPKNIHQIEQGSSVEGSRKRARGTLALPTLSELFLVWVCSYFTYKRQKCSRHLIFQSHLNRAKFLSYG